jgi:hypothetical protein
MLKMVKRDLCAGQYVCFFQPRKQALIACFLGIKEFLKDTYQTVKPPQIIPDLV